MAASKPVALCNQLLPSDKLCRGIAIRNEQYCRAHIRNHRLLDRERAREQALEHLAARVYRMDLTELLETLQGKLLAVNCAQTFARFPEVSFLLTVAIDELLELKQAALNMGLQLEQNQMGSIFETNQISQMPASIPEIKQMAKIAIS